MNYSLCGVAFRLVCEPEADELIHALQRLFPLVRLRGPASGGGIEIFLRNMPPSGESRREAVSGELVFEAPGLSAIRTEHGYHLRSQGSFLNLDLGSCKAEGSLSCSFLNAPPSDQRGLFLFAFLLLLSGRGLYGLHAAGVSWNECGFLLAGSSGSGKTTLTCALARSGWQYLSDDAVLLRRRGPAGVEALAFGRPFHCTPSLFHYFPELTHGAEHPALRARRPATHGKHLVDVGPVYVGQARSGFRPQVILFPEISSAPTSRLIPLERTTTLLRLLGEGAGFLGNRDYMATQMELLGDLARSARGFRLLHGADVHTNPSRVSELLRRIASESPISHLQGVCADAMCSAA